MEWDEENMEKNIIKTNKKYFILCKNSGELIDCDSDNYFKSLEDAQNYILEYEGNIQRLSILEVSKVFECEVNFKPKALYE